MHTTDCLRVSSLGLTVPPAYTKLSLFAFKEVKQLVTFLLTNNSGSFFFHYGGSLTTWHLRGT